MPKSDTRREGEKGFLRGRLKDNGKSEVLGVTGESKKGKRLSIKIDTRRESEGKKKRKTTDAQRKKFKSLFFVK